MTTMRKWLLGGLVAAVAAAGVALAQVPSLFITTLTGTEQIDLRVPSSGTIVTTPQITSITATNLAKYTAAVGAGVNAQTGTSYTILATDMGKLITSSNTGAVAWTLPQAGSTGFTGNVMFQVQNLNTGAVTITPTTSTIYGSATYVINNGRGATIFSDGTNWQVEAGASGLQATPAKVAEGGTGVATLTAHGVLLGEGTGNVVPTAVGTTGQLFMGSSGADPGWATTLSGAYTFSGSSITVTPAITPTGGLAPAGGFTSSPRNLWSCGVSYNGATAAFSAQTPVSTEVYIAEVFVPANVTVTGVTMFNSGTISGNVKVGLANSSGVNVATSASTAQSGTSTIQLVPFTAPYAAVGPATYYITTFFDNNTTRPWAVTLGSCGAAKQTGQTFATGFTTITPPTTFSTALGTVSALY